MRDFLPALFRFSGGIMPSFNQVLLMGNVTRDPQVKTLPNGSQVADFGLAVNRKFRTAAGEDKEEVCFVDCAAFGKQAEVIAQYCTKGKPLFVQGRLKYDTWEDKAGGKRSKLSVIVETFQFVGGRDGGGSFKGSAAESEWRDEPARRGTKEKQFEGPAKFSQADIPF
jgi:single-strand DNA-binding protein